MDKFTKADLKPGMIVETRNGNRYITHEFNGALILVRDGGWLDLLNHEEDLLYSNRDDNVFDIMTVRKPAIEEQFIEDYWKEAPIIWERKELPKMTEVERVILENARVEGKRAKWIGRDCAKDLFLYLEKPTKEVSYWGGVSSKRLIIFNHLFQFVKWEDNEPWYIPDLLGGVDE